MASLEPDHDVFISFSSQDSDKAEAVCERLEAEGCRCWISLRDVKPGQNYQAAIVQAIKRAKIMVLIFSSNANLSEEISKELSLASTFKVTVIPVRTMDVVPQGPFFYELATRQWIDAFKGWDAALGKLARATRRMLDGSSDAAPLEPPVPRASSLPGSRTVVSEEDLEAARLAMTRFVGPIAKFIVSKAANTAQSLEDFHARLIADLPADERSDCIARLRQTIRAAKK